MIVTNWLAALRREVRQFARERTDRRPRGAPWQACAGIAALVEALEPRRLLSAVPTGSEFLVNTTTASSQSIPAVASDADGDYVITWSSNDQPGNFDVYARRYNAAGVAQGDEFLVNTTTADTQLDSAVAMDADGDFVITWSNSNNQSASIFARRYNAAGVAQGDEFFVGAASLFASGASEVAMDADGDFVVTWNRETLDFTNHVFARRFNAAGVAQGDEFFVTTATVNQYTSSVAMDPNGSFVIAWYGDMGSGQQTDIFARRYNAAGVEQGIELNVNTTTLGSQMFPAVAMDGDGNFGVAWESLDAFGTDPNIYARRFSAAGIAQGNDFIVHATTTGHQVSPDAAADADGNFVVAWTNSDGTSASNDVFARCFNSAGTPIGTEFLVNTTTANSQDSAAVAMDAEGDFVIAWTSSNVDFNQDVFAQQYARVATDNLPPIVNNQTFSVAENSAAGTVVGTVTASDPNVGQALTYTITGGNANNAFALNAATGVITVNNATALDFETMPLFAVTVSVTDNGTPALSSMATMTINLTDVNETVNLPPVVGNQTSSLGENSSTGTVVGTVMASDPNPGQSLTYAITGGNTNDAFALNATTGVLTVNNPAALDIETTPMFALAVSVTDSGAPNLSSTATMTINLTDEEPENLPPVFNDQAFSIAENTSAGTVVGTAMAADANPGQTISYAIIGGNTNDAFAINAATGAITVNNPAALNFETMPTFLLTVQATDNGIPARSDTATVTVALTNVNDAPVLDDRTLLVAENSGPGAIVGIIGASDDDVGQTLTYEILSGNPDGLFAINSATGQITATASIDFEATPQFSLTVRVTDSGSPALSDTAVVTVGVIDINLAVELDEDGDLTITGEGGRDDQLTIAADKKGKGLTISDPNGELSSTIEGATVSADGKTVKVAFSLIPGDQILVDTGDGDDSIQISGGKFAKALHVFAETDIDTVSITGAPAFNGVDADGVSLAIFASGNVAITGATSARGELGIHGDGIQISRSISSKMTVALTSHGTLTQTGGELKANQVIVAADEGSIGTESQFLKTRTTFLAALASNDGIFVQDADGVIVGYDDDLSEAVQFFINEGSSLQFTEVFAAGELPGMWTGGELSPIWIRSKNLTVRDRIEAVAGDILVRADGKVQLEADIETEGGVWLRGVAQITQEDGGIIAASLAVASKKGSIVLDSAENDVELLAASARAKGKGVFFRNAGDLTIGTLDGDGLFATPLEGIVAAGDVEVLAAGDIFVDSFINAGRFIRLQSETGDITDIEDGPMKAKAIGASAAGVIDLTAANNSVKLFAGQAGLGLAEFRDDDGFQTGTVPAGFLIGEITSA